MLSSQWNGSRKNILITKYDISEDGINENREDDDRLLYRLMKALKSYTF